MANIHISNPFFFDNLVLAQCFTNWTIGANFAWSASDYTPQNAGVDGTFAIAGAGNTLVQSNVFTDYGTGVNHRIKINVDGILGATAVSVLFGTVTAGTITTTGIQYFTASAATNADFTLNITQGAISINYIMDATIIDYTLTGSNQTLVAPVYNPIFFNVTSTNSALENFRYVFDVYTGGTGSGVAQGRVKLLPRPGGSANCIFSPARILESYLSYNIRIQNIVQPTNSAGHFIPYIIRFGEEWGSLTTGVTIYSALTYFSGYTFNGVLQYDQIPSWNYQDYLATPFAQGKNLLTNQPSTGVYIKNTTDRGTLSLMQINSATTSAVLTTYQKSGGTLSYQLKTTGITSTSVVHIPAGIWNLNNLPNSGTTVNINTDYKYTIAGYNSTLGANVTNSATYLIDDRCSKYPTVRMQFLNRLGGFDYFNFNLVSKKSLTVKRDTYRKVLAYDYSLGDRGETVLNIDGNYSYKVNSDWVTDEESIWLEELMTSPEVYVIGSDGISSPIIIDDTMYEVKKSLNDKLFNYTISYHVASKINGQRG